MDSNTSTKYERFCESYKYLYNLGFYRDIPDSPSLRWVQCSHYFPSQPWSWVRRTKGQENDGLGRHRESRKEEEGQ